MNTTIVVNQTNMTFYVLCGMDKQDAAANIEALYNNPTDKLEFFNGNTYDVQLFAGLKKLKASGMRCMNGQNRHRVQTVFGEKKILHPAASLREYRCNGWI